MAQRVVTQLVSDLSGTEIEDGSGESIAFSVRGTAYTIDLTAGEAADFDAALAPYVEKATRTSGKRRTISNFKKASAPGPDTTDVREWARDHGFEVAPRGRISAEVLEAYAAAH